MTALRDVVKRAFSNVSVEHADTTLRRVSGEVPDELNGVLFRNGPGRFDRGRSYGHPFDGDGMLARFELAGGRVRYTNRFVRTRELAAEERAGRVLHRGFGTNRSGGVLGNTLRLRFKNAANTNVVAHAGKLLALWEGGWPHEIDPRTLATVGRTSFDGALENRFSHVERWVNPELPFAAHPRRDPARGQLLSFGLAYGLRRRLLIHAVDDAGRCTTSVIELDRLAFVHDFAITPSWFVFLVPAVRFRMLRTALGVTTPARSITDGDGPMTALLVPRGGGEPIAIETAPGFAFHVANAFHTPAGQVVCDAMVMPAFPELSRPEHLLDAPHPELMAVPTRLVLDPRTRTAQATALSDVAMETPVIATADGRPHRVIWGTAVPPGQTLPYYSAIARLVPDTGELALRDFAPDIPGEPIVVTAPASSRARYLLTVVYIARDHVSDLVVLDASTLTTVARLRLPHHLPPGLHGSWLSARDYATMFAPRAAALPRAA